MRMRTSDCDTREYGAFVLRYADRTLVGDDFDHLVSRGFYDNEIFIYKYKSACIVNNDLFTRAGSDINREMGLRLLKITFILSIM